MFHKERKRAVAKMIMEETKTGQRFQELSEDFLKVKALRVQRDDFFIIGAIMPTLWKLGLLP